MLYNGQRPLPASIYRYLSVYGIFDGFPQFLAKCQFLTANLKSLLQKYKDIRDFQPFHPYKNVKTEFLTMGF